MRAARKKKEWEPDKKEWEPVKIKNAKEKNNYH